MNPVHYSSEHPDWETPDDLFERLHDFARLIKRPLVDIALPGREGTELDALTGPWIDRIAWSVSTPYFNPPYGRGIGRWFDRASEFRHPTIALHPARTDTRWFPWNASAILFFRGRLRFKGAPAGAPFPSALSLLSVAPTKYAIVESFERNFCDLGKVVIL